MYLGYHSVFKNRNILKKEENANAPIIYEEMSRGKF